MLIDTSDSEEEENGKKRIKLAGSRDNDFSERRFHPEIRVSRISFCPTGRDSNQSFLLLIVQKFIYFCNL